MLALGLTVDSWLLDVDDDDDDEVAILRCCKSDTNDDDGNAVFPL